MSRKFVSANKKDGTITISHDDTTEQPHDVTDDAAVTLNGKPAKLSDLKAGDELTYEGDPITSVSATR